MPTQGDLTYYERLGEAGQAHAVNKPFSDDDCGINLMRVGGLMAILPPPPARILECGCGTGWLSWFLHRRGYDVVGSDVSAEAIRLARIRDALPFGPTFIVADSESLPFTNEFDAVVYFDSLHHSVSERDALRCACRALRTGGVCVAVEPGWGHRRSSRHVIEELDVTEKDMPPRYVGRLGRSVGFRTWRCYPAPDKLGKALFARQRVGSRWLRGLLSIGIVRLGIAAATIAFARHYAGITVLQK